MQASYTNSIWPDMRKWHRSPQLTGSGTLDQVIILAINDLNGDRTSKSLSAQDSATEWFAAEADTVGSFI